VTELKPSASKNRKLELELDGELDAPKPAGRREKRVSLGDRSAPRFLALWFAAVLATVAAFVVHLAMRHEVNRLGLDVDAARREQRRLVEQRRLLSTEAATLRQAPRVEAVARGHLEMEVPAPERIVPIDGRPRQSRRTAGRVR
jgi:cell division protein FtsL